MRSHSCASPKGASPLIDSGRDGWHRRPEAGFAALIDRPTDGPMEFSRSVARGLQSDPRVLASRYLYDDRGSEIFERITEQPEYYQTRTEAALIAAHAEDIRRRVGDVTLVELGAGSCAKTRRLLEAWCAAGEARFVPIDISGEMLASTCDDLSRRFPRLTIDAMAASYERALPLIGAASPLLLLFLGSSVGNLDHAAPQAAIEMLAAHLSQGDWLVLGVDLVKDTSRLEAAYRDAAGWTARFTKNLFVRMNRELGTEIPQDAVEHVASYNEELSRIEIYACFLRDVLVSLPLVGRRFHIGRGEMILTETSYKFRVDDVARTARPHGLMLEQTYTDANAQCALLLFRRIGA